MRRKETVAMLLAGGQGSRLGVLTEKIAKPAVSFGGKYRMIDFSLSNCVNSGIDTVGVLIQYKPFLLNKYLGTGEAWNLDDSTGGVHILPPYATESGGQWYQGTADAIYHNIDFIDSYDPEFVLILSGDHLYQMDYNLMLDYHKLMKADLTVAVKTVPMAEASRFGIMTTDEELRVTKFTEKPREPDSDLASMGIYIFSWPVLREALLRDHEAEGSEHDFGKNIIPTLLGEGKRLFAYVFSGYWKDVGTIPSYYATQMELLEKNPSFSLFERRMRIFSNLNEHAPEYIGPEGSAERSLICNGCEILGRVSGSVLSPGVYIGPGASVEDSVLLPNSRVEAGARVRRTILNEEATIAGGALVGDGESITVVGAGATMRVEE
ncbi:MAG: glucose-1-phosphate adenylyltransferase [Oscillospiraceae bacterium]|nr:glucose-1-phosphate adenylyltransferase [bacterium]MDY5101042.1 glucose-1-phosphate adenylyltransferase [Oscillospiraceae bacterium]